jgi:hypothetical protein
MRRIRISCSTKVSSAIITELPKSGCCRQSRIRTPAISACGRKPTVKLRIRSRFFESEYAR